MSIATFIVLPIEAGSVFVQPVMVRAVPLSAVHSACGNEGDFEACTRFVAYRLDAECAGRKLHASVTFRPVVFVFDLHQLTHEYTHVDDVRAYATEYASQIEEMTFDSDEQCRDAALSAAGRFGETMREFAGRSMRHIH
jgi:hypothetical protein